MRARRRKPRSITVSVVGQTHMAALEKSESDSRRCCTVWGMALRPCISDETRDVQLLKQGYLVNTSDTHAVTNCGLSAQRRNCKARARTDMSGLSPLSSAWLLSALPSPSPDNGSGAWRTIQTTYGRVTICGEMLSNPNTHARAAWTKSEHLLGYSRCRNDLK